MSDLKDKVANYLSTFLDKEMVEVSSSTEDYFAGLEKEATHKNPEIARKASERLAKAKASSSSGRVEPASRPGQTFSAINTPFRYREVGRTYLGSVVRNIAKHNIGAAAERASKIKDAAELQGNITKAEGGADSSTRHQLKRQAWKHTLATKGPAASAGAPAVRGRRGKDVGRIGTAITTALMGATKDPRKKALLVAQGRAPNNTIEPDFSAKSTTKKFVSQEVLADLRAKAAKK